MKKFLKILIVGTFTLLTGVLAYTYIGYNFWSPGNVETVADQSLTKYYQDSYNECRSSFRKKADEIKLKFDSVDVFPIPVSGKTDNDLTIDVCYIPAKKEKSNLLILSSGTHGIEGFVGSAVQNMEMDEILKSEQLSETGILFIHAMNPYGFKYLRRVTENNIDLNRNCDTDTAIFSSDNKGYSQLYDMLNPSGKASIRSMKNQFFMLVAIQKLVKESMKSLRQAVLQGQYQYKEGLYFGGKSLEPLLNSVTPFFIKYALDYENILNIDLHTGYGELGVLHLFPNPVEDPVIRSAMETIFAGYKIDWGDSDDFYTINGSLSDYIGKLLPGKRYVPMSFEYGTLNSQTTTGSIHSIHNMILENQGFHYGFKTDKDKQKVMKNFTEMYNPSSDEWRTKVLSDTRKMMVSVFEKFNKFQ